MFVSWSASPSRSALVSRPRDGGGDCCFAVPLLGCCVRYGLFECAPNALRAGGEPSLRSSVPAAGLLLNTGCSDRLAASAVALLLEVCGATFSFGFCGECRSAIVSSASSSRSSSTRDTGAAVLPPAAAGGAPAVDAVALIDELDPANDDEVKDEEAGTGVRMDEGT